MGIDQELKRQVESKYQSIRRYSSPMDYRRIKAYINEVLPLELDCARSDNRESKRLPDNEYQHGLLVLLVGFSFDPLFQTILAYQPKEIMLVLNKNYGNGPDGVSGENQARDLESHISMLPLEHKISIEKNTFSYLVLENDHPEFVFSALRRTLMPRLQKYPCTVLDITGGKKSMVTGAFLFGAFTGVHLSYVDFDEYDPIRRVPLGYTYMLLEPGRHAFVNRLSSRFQAMQPRLEPAVSRL